MREVYSEVGVYSEVSGAGGGEWGGALYSEGESL